MATITTHRVGPANHGQRMTLDEFIDAEFEPGWLYELARGVIDVTEVPGLSHGRIVGRITRMFVLYDEAHPGTINYRAGSGECRLRLPGMQSDRHPDQAIYLDPAPSGPNLWARWIPHVLIEVLSPGGETRDLVEKREEYLRAGVSEYWILEPVARQLRVLRRAGDVWEEVVVAADAIYHSHFLPGLEVRPGELIGPAEGE